MHPPRERVHIDSTLHTATTSSLLRAGGRGGPPLRGGFVSLGGSSTVKQHQKQNFRNIRRPRHARDASTARAVTRFLRDSHHHKIQRLRFPVRADTAVRPYAEDLFQEEVIPQSDNIKNRIFVTPGDIGTRERLVSRRGITNAERQIRNRRRNGYTQYAYAVQTNSGVLRNAIGEFT